MNKNNLFSESGFFIAVPLNIAASGAGIFVAGQGEKTAAA